MEFRLVGLDFESPCSFLLSAEITGVGPTPGSNFVILSFERTRLKFLLSFRTLLPHST